MRRAHFVLLLAAVLVVTGAALLLAERAPSGPTASGATIESAAEAPGVAIAARAAVGPRSARVERGNARPAASLGRCGVRGRIVDGNGASVVGATVNIEGIKAKTDREGRFELRRLAAHAEASIAIEARGFAHLVRTITLWPDAANDLGDLMLHPAARIVGRVVDAEGAPVGGAAVVSESPCGRGATSRADGSFEFASLGPGVHRVRARLVGHPASAVAEVDVEVGATARCEDLVLPRARALAGRVTDEREAPVAGAEVCATAKTTGEAFTAVTRRDGSFEWAAFPDGEAEIVVTHAGYLPFARRHDPNGGEAKVRLTAARAVFGRVVDARDGTPVPLQTVALLVAADPNGPWRQLAVEHLGQDASTASKDVGAFCLPMGIHANVRVVATSATHAPVLTESAWMGRRDVGPLLAMANSGVAARGVLRDERGCPVPDAAIEVLAVAAADGVVQTGADVVLAQTRTDAEGAFVTTPLAVGPHRVRAHRAGYMAAIAGVEVRSRADAPLELLATRAGALRGSVLGCEPGARLRVVAEPRSGLGPRERAPSTVVENGTFCFASLPVDTYRLRVLGIRDGKVIPTFAVAVEVKAGRQRWVEIVADPLLASGPASPNGR